MTPYGVIGLESVKFQDCVCSYYTNKLCFNPLSSKIVWVAISLYMQTVFNPSSSKVM